MSRILRSATKDSIIPPPAKKQHVEQVTEKIPKNPPVKKQVSNGLLKVGDLISDFEFKNQNDDVVLLKELVKESGIVIFMYPKANTPGCTKQACGFRDNHQKFVDAGYKIFGLSADSPKSHTTWKAKYDLQYDLLSDPDYKAIKAFGAFKSPKGIKRSHLIIEKGGKVSEISIQISPAESYESAISFVESD